MVYLLSYDVHGRSEAFYTTLAQELSAKGARRILLSEWIIASTLTAEQLCNWLGGLIEIRSAADRVLVVEIGAWWWSRNAMDEGGALLKQLRP